MPSYRLLSARVAYEDVDDEIIAIDFVSGAYFCMAGTAADLWRRIMAGASEAAVVEACGAAAGETGRAEAAAFLAELAAAGLVAPAPEAGADRCAPLSAYRPPVLEMFTDMAELVALDPIHDVSPEGWPHARAPSGG